MSGATDSVAGAVAVAGVTESHAASSATLTFSEPLPALVTDAVCAAGLEAPCVAVNVRLAGVTESAGGGGTATVSVTGIAAGDPVAPPAFTVTVPVYVPAARPDRAAVT